MISRETEHDVWDHLRNRPAEAERNAVRRLSRYKGMRINICHCTDPVSAKAASDAGFTTEVTLHHMLFAAEDVSGTAYKVNPPIRDRATRDALVKRVMSGGITMLGSDHAPHTQQDKSQDFDAAPGGMTGVETTVPILMEKMMRGRFPLDLLVRMGAENPARVFSANKGRIAVGYDADFAVFDTRNVTQVDADMLHSKAGQTPYQGMGAIFPDAVLVRGNLQIVDGEYCGEALGADIVDDTGH